MAHSRKEMIDELKRCYKLKESIKLKDIKDELKIEPVEYRKEWKNWNNVKDIFKNKRYIVYTSEQANSSKDEVKKDIINTFSSYKKEDDITLEEYKQKGNFSYYHIQCHFNTWNECIEEIDLYKMREEEIIKSIHRNFPLVPLGDELPSIKDIQKNTEYSSKDIKFIFENYEKLAEKAGYSYNRKQKITKEKLGREINRLKEELGHYPTKNEMNKNGKYSVMPYRNRFGSYGNALENCGFDFNNRPRKSRAENGGTTNLYGKDWISVRDSIRNRDNNKCRVCGRKEKKSWPFCSSYKTEKMVYPK